MTAPTTTLPPLCDSGRQDRSAPSICTRCTPTQPRPGRRSAGFTLIELMVTIAVLGLTMAMIIPNLGALVPSARIDGSAKDIAARLQMVRSEARIQAKQMSLELDLDRDWYRVIYPPEDRLTSDQTVYEDKDLGDEDKDWLGLEPDVEFAGAGDAIKGLADKGVYSVTFDEYGFSADQVIVLRLKSNPQQVSTLSIRGLTGKVEIHRSEEGEVFRPERIDEGAF